MKLEHYSNHPNLMELGIDPRHHGSGVRGAESKRKLNDPKNWVDRSYHYRAGTQPEAMMSQLPHVYTHEADESKIYDFDGDPKNLKAQSFEDGIFNVNLYEKNIRDSGHHGYVSQSTPNTVALFHPVKPTG